MVKKTEPIVDAKNSLPQPVRDNSGCILFPKSPKFLQILKKAACATLHVEITYDNETKKGVNFNASDSTFFGNALKGADLEFINRVAVLDGGSPDDHNGIKEKDSKYLPLAIICDTREFVALSIKNYPPNGRPATLICSFTSTGKFIDGFVANYGLGNEHWSVSRASIIDKAHIIKITETGQGNQSDDDNYTFSATWKISDNGRFIRIKENVKYGNEYQSDDNRFTKIK
jgi:hypothetical protein